jgi:hypothetical protein
VVRPLARPGTADEPPAATGPQSRQRRRNSSNPSRTRATPPDGAGPGRRSSPRRGNQLPRPAKGIGHLQALGRKKSTLEREWAKTRVLRLSPTAAQLAVAGCGERLSGRYPRAPPRKLRNASAPTSPYAATGGRRWRERAGCPVPASADPRGAAHLRNTQGRARRVRAVAALPGRRRDAVAGLRLPGASYLLASECRAWLDERQNRMGRN